MADGPIIRPLFAAMLFKVEATEGVDSVPTATDAIQIEIDSFTPPDPYRTEEGNEAAGSLVAGAPRVFGQPVTLKFRARIKGAGAVYTASVKPPHHALLQSCGRRGVFQAAITPALCSAGSATSATLNASYAATANLYRGMPAQITAGAGANKVPFIADYTAGRVATLTDTFSPVLDSTSNIAIPANWTYAGTSPLSVAQRATDHPSGTLYYYEDGTLYKYVGVRGKVDVMADAQHEGFFEFEMTGVFAGKSDASIPSGISLPTTSGPLFLQSANLSEAFLVGRKALPVSKFSLSDGGIIESPDDANSTYGFNPAIIGQRRPVLSADPAATTVASRDTLGDISAGTQMTGVVRMTSSQYNRFAITFPLLQKTASPYGVRGTQRSENLAARAISPSVDSNTRDGDSIWCFW